MEQELRALLLLVCLLSTNGFTLRRRSSQNPYDLSRALDVLARERRRIENQEYLQELLRGQNLYPYEDDDGYLSYRDTYSSPGTYSIADILDAYPGLSLSESKDVMPSEKRSLHPRMTKPSLAELEAIFGSRNDIPERSKKRDTSTSYSKSSENKLKLKSKKDELLPEATKSEDNSDKESKQISESEMEKLLSEAEKVDKESIEEDVKEKETSELTEPVSKEELKTVFTKEESDDSETDKAKSENDDNKNTETEIIETKEISRNSPAQDEPFDAQRFWKLNDYVNLASGNKRKRVTKRDFSENADTQKTMIELVSEVEALRDEVSRLKLVEFLEDKENDFLASALKDATLAQLQGTDQYLKGEYGDIENAIEVEEILQAVKSDQPDEEGADDEAPDIDVQSQDLPEVVAPIDDKDSVEDVQEVSEPKYIPVRTAEEREKRVDEEPSLEDNMGRWYERPVRGHTMSQDEAESVLETLMENYGKESDKNSQDEIPAAAFEPSDEDVDSMPSSKQNPLQYELPSDITIKQEFCPEVQEFNDNCVIADAVGLPIDADARGLCNRHQTCYVCGATLGFSMGQCDSGFRGDIIELCGEDSKCILNGAKFLAFIKGYHRFNFDYTRQCDVSCIKDYIIGL